MLATLVQRTPAPTLSTPERLAAIDPLHEPDWDNRLLRHPGSSFFHTQSWARVLHETYGHRPIYFCRLGPASIEELLPIMEVRSPWTGRRGVSLPFTDFCRPLTVHGSETGALYERAMELGSERGWRYLESRCASQDWAGSRPSLHFFGHSLELEGGTKLWHRLEGSVRRAIRKAESEGLRVEFELGTAAMREYYGLHCLTRKRHGLPPQPWRFFENIARYVFGADQGFVTLARLRKQPVAGAVFFHHGREAVFKFGASDYRHQQLRGNDLVMWAAIQRFAAEGYARLDLGRTSLPNEGLRRYKLGFGPREEKMGYCKYDFGKREFVRDQDRAHGWFNAFFRGLPLPILRLAGRMLYPHLS